MPDIDTVLAWRGRTVRDRDGEKIGTFGDLYLDEEATVPPTSASRPGCSDREESIVPLEGAHEADDGDVHVAYALETIKAAPNVEPEVALDEQEADRLLEHYGEPTRMRRESAEMIRSEEEVELEVEPAKPKEHVRLKKYTVTEQVEKKVPVRREEIRVVNDPPESGRVVRVEDVD